MLGQNGVKKDAKQRAAKHARQHDQADCDGTHDRPAAAEFRSLRGDCWLALRDFFTDETFQRRKSISRQVLFEKLFEESGSFAYWTKVQ
jgi:hypothetical protein